MQNAYDVTNPSGAPLSFPQASQAIQPSQARGGGRPPHTFAVVRDNADMYQAPRELSARCRVFGKTLHHASAFLIGGGITAGTTYALVKHVQHAIANASVSQDPAVWTDKAHAKYDDCYNGCNDCDDTSFAYNACATTAKILVDNTVCDGNAMWNWLAKYPQPCLNALGEVIREQALAAARQDKRNQLAIIILTVLAGGIGWYASYKLMGCVASRLGANRNNRNNPQEA